MRGGAEPLRAPRKVCVCVGGGYAGGRPRGISPRPAAEGGVWRGLPGAQPTRVRVWLGTNPSGLFYAGARRRDAGGGADEGEAQTEGFKTFFFLVILKRDPPSGVRWGRQPRHRSPRAAGTGRRRRPRTGTRGVSRGASAAVFPEVGVFRRGRWWGRGAQCRPLQSVEAVPVPPGQLLVTGTFAGLWLWCSTLVWFFPFLGLVRSCKAGNAERVRAGENRAVGPSAVWGLTFV